MTGRKLRSIKTISEFHRLRQLPQPDHPLMSIVSLEELGYFAVDDDVSLTLDFYWIALRRTSDVKARYGQQAYDFDKGILSFMSPGQVFTIELKEKDKVPEKWGRALLIHPDFLWGTSLAKTITKYDFFGYSVNEALFLSAKEERTIIGIFGNILQEYHSNIDTFSKRIIITHIENLLSYSERFYHRQFITREKANHQLLERLEKVLNDYFNDDDLISKGLPTVQYVAGQLHVSSVYLGSLLRAITGQNTQQHIHNKLIEKAKEKLSATQLSVNEIAYGLGFGHAQSFSRLFKARTALSPLAFRKSFS